MSHVQECLENWGYIEIFTSACTPGSRSSNYRTAFSPSTVSNTVFSHGMYSWPVTLSAFEPSNTAPSRGNEWSGRYPSPGFPSSMMLALSGYALRRISATPWGDPYADTARKRSLFAFSGCSTPNTTKRATSRMSTYPGKAPGMPDFTRGTPE